MLGSKIMHVWEMHVFMKHRPQRKRYKYFFVVNILIVVVVVVLLFYVHSKHLRSCRDGQLP